MYEGASVRITLREGMGMGYELTKYRAMRYNRQIFQ